MRCTKIVTYIGGGNRIKTLRNHAKTEIPASTSIIHLFRAFLWPMSQTQT